MADLGLNLLILTKSRLFSVNEVFHKVNVK